MSPRVSARPGTSSTSAIRGRPCRARGGSSPVSIWCSTSPSAKTSVRSSSGAPRRCSGAMCVGVPPPGRGQPNARARPKSRIFTAPSSHRNRLAGTSPGGPRRARARRRVRAPPAPRRAAPGGAAADPPGGGQRPSARGAAPARGNVPCSQRPTSNSVTTFGCSRFAAASASRMTRSSAVRGPVQGTSLNATSRPARGRVPGRRRRSRRGRARGQSRSGR